MKQLKTTQLTGNVLKTLSQRFLYILSVLKYILVTAQHSNNIIKTLVSKHSLKRFQNVIGTLAERPENTFLLAGYTTILT